MNTVEAFEIDDDFDPLADFGPDEDDDTQGADYMPPIPDAELSRMPEIIPLTPAESIGKLVIGIPGQRFRLLHAVDFCNEPHTLEEIVADLDAAFPRDVSVYSAAQIVQLLEEAGALEAEEPASEEGADPSGEHPTPDALLDGNESSDDEGSFLTVVPAAPRLYTATEAGRKAVEESCGEHVVYGALTEEERYLPLYRTILEMVSEPGGCPTKELDAVIDIDPLCEEPRRFCGYFLGRLESTGAIMWRDTWVATDLGKTALASDLFND